MCSRPRCSRPAKPACRSSRSCTTAIAEPRPEVNETAPKIISFNIPMDKIGEVIGPKGKVINTIQQETGADIAVDDDGQVGIVTIGSVDGGAVAEARRQIDLIINPPSASVGEIYPGKVVNITKFGAFVNILPGRDGLVHISKLGRGKRIERVEDVLELGDEIMVRVDDIDPNGKVSLTPIVEGDEGDGPAEGSGDGGASRAPRFSGGSSSSSAASGASVSFEDSFEAEAREQFGDLGPAAASAPSGGGSRSSGSGDRGRGAVAAAAATGAAAVAEGSRIECTQLASGVRVISERMPEAHSACVGVWVGVGARDEPDSLSGVSHFLEHLLFKGSDTRSARDIAQAVDRVGGDMNAFTAKEYTAYVARLPSKHVALGVELLADVLTRPSLRDDDIDAERQVILEELHMDEDTPDDRVHTLVFESLFPQHPLGRETAGSADTVEAIAPEDIRSFFGEHYGPSAFVVAAAGLIDHEQVVADVEAHFGPRACHLGRAPQQAHVARPSARGVEAVDRAGPPRDRLPGADANRSRSGGPRGAEPCDRRGHVEPPAPDDPRGPRASRTPCTPRTPSSATRAHSRSTRRRPRRGWTKCSISSTRRSTQLGNDGVTADELDVALGYLEGSLVLGLEDSGSRMARLGGSLTVRGHVRTIDEQLDRYRAVTRADVQTRRAAGAVGTTLARGRRADRQAHALPAVLARITGRGAVRRSSSSSPCSDPAASACRACRWAGAAARPRSRSTAGT